MLTLRNNERSPLHFSDEPGWLPGVAGRGGRHRLQGVGEISSTSSMKAPRPLDGTILKLPGMLDRLLHHGYTLPKGVADEISLIKLDLNKIMAISSNLQEDDRAMMVRCWRKEVRELSYDMEDFIDQYEEHAAAMTIRARKITRRHKSKAPWLGEKLRQRLWMSNKIREFSVHVQETLERHKLYNLDAIAGSASTRCMDAYPTWSSTPYGEENTYVGTGAAMAKLEELLMQTDGHEHQKLKVVSIVGFGGIGKTTLAMELYHKIGRQFECRAFVRTSQKPDMRRIFISMFSQVCPHQPPDNWTVHSLLSTIRTHLQDKRYLIIVEDLCATSTWDIVKCALPDSNCCSRIVATTEIEDLALQSCDHDPKYVYKMQPLGEDNSKKLFFSSVFGPQHECPPELMEISHDIIRKCGGFPLAIVTVASILSSRQGIQDQWDYVNKSIGYSLLMKPTFEGMKQVLDLSYNNLPQHLKACILYTGLYEENTIIWKDDLVNQWIAEGFIQATEGQDKKEIAKYFFDRLISRKLILPVDINRNGEVLSCTVHHMVLNLVIRSRSIEENFITAIHHSQASTTLADKVRRLSLQFANAEDAIPPTNMRLSHVRTLAFWGVFKCLPYVARFCLLQVLILHFWGDKDSITFDITRISKLFRLRYLKVTSNVSLELHGQMRGLQSLETLTIDTRTSAVPSDIVQLPGLLHLNLPAEANLPNGIGHMTSLRSLGYFDVSSNSIEDVQSLSMLTNLRDLQLTCSTVQPENLNSKMQFLLNSILGRLGNLKSLTLVPRASSHAKSIDDAGATCTNIISVGLSSLFSASALLQSLEVSPRICIFLFTPRWMGPLHNLCVLKFGVTKIHRDDVDVLRGLPALAVLSLYVQTKPAARIVIGKTGFPVLKYFKFKCCDPLLEFEEGAMPNLRKLKLAFNACNAHPQSTIPVSIEYLSELREVSVKIGGADPEESDRRAAESAFRDAIRVHAKCQRVNIQCVTQVIGNTDDQSSIQSDEVLTSQSANDAITTTTKFSRISSDAFKVDSGQDTSESTVTEADNKFGTTLRPARSPDQETSMPPDRILRRLAQNREAARKSRMRKKAYIHQVETSRENLAQLERELHQARQQAAFANRNMRNSTLGFTGPMDPGVAGGFEIDYSNWVEQQNKHTAELRSALQGQTSELELGMLVETALDNYEHLYRINALAANADVFYVMSGMWKTPAERFFLWIGGFRPSEVLKILWSQLELLTEAQHMALGTLRHTSTQAEDALSQGMEKLHRNLAETLTAAAGRPPDGYMLQMATAVEKLRELVGFVTQADHLRQMTLRQMHKILTTRQAAMALLALGNYFHRIRTLSHMWATRGRD